MDGTILSALLLALSSQDRTQSALAPYTGLPPRAFHQLPAAIVKSLEARKCSIPQSPFDKTPQNVVRGSFTGAKRNEWAVLCSRGGISSILVFRADSDKPVADIAAQKDDNYLVQEGQQAPYLSRAISAAGKDYILEHYKAYGGPKPPPITHQGIEDSFLEKASIVRYFYRGKWLELQGAD
jgi:hypothetical protein